MVVLLPKFEGELFKRCNRCSTIGLCSPIAARSTFYVRRRSADYRPECRRCTTAAAVAQQAKRREREGERYYERRRRIVVAYRERNRETRRAQERASLRLRREADPEAWRKRQREVQQRYQAKLRQDPERVAAQLEHRRISYRLRQERKGRTLRIANEAKLNRDSVRLPVGPFQQWIERLLVEDQRMHGVEGSEGRIAERLGVQVRTLYRWRRRTGTVGEVAVDRAVSREGSVSLWDLYPEQRDYPPGQQEAQEVAL